MTPFRIAVLIFVVGASVANWSFYKQEYRYMEYLMVHVTKPHCDTRGLPPSAKCPPEATMIRMQRDTAEAAGILAACFSQVIIITIAGVAWFLVREPTLPR